MIDGFASIVLFCLFLSICTCWLYRQALLKWKNRAEMYDNANRQLMQVIKRGDFLTALRHANITRQTEWDRGNQITLEYRGNEFAGEAGELCNVIKKLARERMGIRGSRATVEMMKEEGADVLICLDLIFAHQGIDLIDAVRAKFNKTSAANNLATRL